MSSGAQVVLAPPPKRWLAVAILLDPEPTVVVMTTTTVTRAHAAVTLRGVSRVYGRGAAAVRAVDDVTVDFPRGGWTAVMGPSGSGKSTLLHCAAGLERV